MVYMLGFEVVVVLVDVECVNMVELFFYLQGFCLVIVNWFEVGVVMIQRLYCEVVMNLDFEVQDLFECVLCFEEVLFEWCFFDFELEFKVIVFLYICMEVFDFCFFIVIMMFGIVFDVMLCEFVIEIFLLVDDEMEVFLWKMMEVVVDQLWCRIVVGLIVVVCCVGRQFVSVVMRIRIIVMFVQMLGFFVVILMSVEESV